MPWFENTDKMEKPHFGGFFGSLLPFCANSLINRQTSTLLLFHFTHNGSISTLQVRLVIDVHDSRQEILRTAEGKEGCTPVFYLSLCLLCTCCRENEWPTDKVFPEPVWAMPTMSLPLRARGNPCAWMAVGSLKFCCISTSMTYSAIKHRGYFSSARWLATAERLEWWYIRGKWAWWKLMTGLGQPVPRMVISFFLRYSSTSYWTI